jgi:hypothetical protein
LLQLLLGDYELPSEFERDRVYLCWLVIHGVLIPQANNPLRQFR